MSEFEPYYSPKWTKQRAVYEFLLRMAWLFDGMGYPCWRQDPWYLGRSNGRLMSKQRLNVVERLLGVFIVVVVFIAIYTLGRP